MQNHIHIGNGPSQDIRIAQIALYALNAKHTETRASFAFRTNARSKMAAEPVFRSHVSQQNLSHP